MGHADFFTFEGLNHTGVAFFFGRQFGFDTCDHEKHRIDEACGDDGNGGLAGHGCSRHFGRAKKHFDVTREHRLHAQWRGWNRAQFAANTRLLAKTLFLGHTHQQIAGAWIVLEAHH